MKVIDLLNKIANGEESDTITEFEFDERIWNFFKLQNSEYCVDGWLLNQEIVITKHKEVIEDKKIEEIDLSEWAEITYQEDWEMLTKDFNRNCNLFVNKINEIIKVLNERGDYIDSN